MLQPASCCAGNRLSPGRWQRSRRGPGDSSLLVLDPEPQTLLPALVSPPEEGFPAGGISPYGGAGLAPMSGSQILSPHSSSSPLASPSRSGVEGRCTQCTRSRAGLCALCPDSTLRGFLSLLLQSTADSTCVVSAGPRVVTQVNWESAGLGGSPGTNALTSTSSDSSGLSGRTLRDNLFERRIVERQACFSDGLSGQREPGPGSKKKASLSEHLLVICIHSLQIRITEFSRPSHPTLSFALPTLRKQPTPNRSGHWLKEQKAHLSGFKWLLYFLSVTLL